MGESPSSDVTALARYGDDTPAGGSTAIASYDASTKKWKTQFYIGGYTDGDFFWWPEASLCTASDTGSTVEKAIVEFADSLNTNPYTHMVFCDTTYVKFYVGGLGDHASKDLTVIISYGDESPSGYTRTAKFDSSTERWEVFTIDVSDFTDGTFYWRPEASVGNCTEEGNSIRKNFHPGQCR